MRQARLDVPRCVGPINSGSRCHNPHTAGHMALYVVHPLSSLFVSALWCCCRAGLRTNSQTHLASVYGGGQSSSSGAGGNRRTASTSSSPVPWEGSQALATDSSSGMSPEVLTLQSNPASARETREDVGVDGAGLQGEEYEQRLQQLQLAEAHPADADLARAHSASSKGAMKLLQLGERDWTIREPATQHFLWSVVITELVLRVYALMHSLSLSKKMVRRTLHMCSVLQLMRAPA